MAVSGRNSPIGDEENGALTERFVTETLLLLIVTVMLADCPLKLAVIDDDPAATPVTTPAAETVASAVFDEVHVDWLVTSLLDPSL